MSVPTGRPTHLDEYLTEIRKHLRSMSENLELIVDGLRQILQELEPGVPIVEPGTVRTAAKPEEWQITSDERSILVKQLQGGPDKLYNLASMPQRVQVAMDVARQIGAPFQVYQETEDGPFRILTDGEVHARVDRMTITEVEDQEPVE